MDSYLDFYISVPIKVCRSAPLTREKKWRNPHWRQRLGTMEWSIENSG